MNKIQLEDVINEEKNIVIDKDCFISITNSNTKINFDIKKRSNVFVFISSSSLDIKISSSCDSIFNVFSISSTLLVNTYLNDSLNFKYIYSSINEEDNKYKININHLGNNINSNIISHGINLKGDLVFDVNAIVPNNVYGVSTNQDSKIILEGGTGLIKPNLLVDTSEVEANHSAYVGEFKEEDLFYLKSRGLDDNTSYGLLAKSFLMGPMDITYKERNIILDILKRYWR